MNAACHNLVVQNRKGENFVNLTDFEQNNARTTRAKNKIAKVSTAVKSASVRFAAAKPYVSQHLQHVISNTLLKLRRWSSGFKVPGLVLAATVVQPLQLQILQ